MATSNGSTAIRDKILASLARYRALRIGKFPCAFWRLSSHPGLTAVEVLDSQGEKRSLKIQENPAFDNDGRCIELSGIAHDITPLIQTREQITLLSYYDDLTGLANNRLFSDRVEQMINLSHRQHQSLALLFIDLDGFKLINDRFGHATGDSALKETANRLSGSRYFCESLFWASQPKQAAKT